MILQGAFTGGDGKPYGWALVHSYANHGTSGTTVYVANDRPDTSAQWTPLSAPSE